jgi:hypothetical protein
VIGTGFRWQTNRKASFSGGGAAVSSQMFETELPPGWMVFASLSESAWACAMPGRAGYIAAKISNSLMVFR